MTSCAEAAGVREFDARVADVCMDLTKVSDQITSAHPALEAT